MSPRRRLAVACLLVAALALLAGCSGPAPEQEVICHGCVDAVENVTGGSGTATVEESVTHVRLQESGDARFVARLEVGDDGETDATTADRVVERIEALERTSYDTRPAFERRDLDARVTGDEVLVTYSVGGMTERRFGVTVTDRFYRADGRGRSDEVDHGPFQIGTDRLVVDGPDGTSPLVGVPGATVKDDRVVWTGNEVSTRSYLVFGDSGGEVRGRTAVAANVIEWAGPQALLASALPVAVLGALAIGFAYRYPRRVADGWNPRDDSLFKALALGPFAVPVGIAALWQLPVPTVDTAVLLAVVTGVVLTARAVRSDDGDDVEDDSDAAPARESTADSRPPAPRRPIGQRLAEGEFGGRGVVYAVVLSATAVAAVTAAVAADFEGDYLGFVWLAAAALPLFAFTALGYLVTDRERTPHRVVAVAAAATAPWLVMFTAIVNGDEVISDLLGMILVPLGQLAGGVLLFYAALWLTTRYRSTGTDA
ncbi:hypothetical protein [Halosimplex pelagicum]|uniref:Uncharacterized protein n=1 Tax=Halosimplex pelagicum TaxID=869886 RepID=A0A7D5TD39_9EURY|nr:hypothetical protein [Halosimplex pelagicum]QLH82635.1 hypothetical protein HZS54_13840 [Halosimplex pelagicum]